MQPLRLETNYNGYRNKASNLVALWIDKTRGDKKYLLETVKVALNAGQNKYRIADLIYSYVEEMCLTDSQTQWGLINDLLTTSLADVDWLHIAMNLIEEVEEQQL